MLWASGVRHVARMTVMVVAVAAALVPIARAEAAGGAWSVERLAGSDRFATSVEVSVESYPDGADRVYLANGYGFADALAAGGARPGPVLLTRESSVPGNVLAEIVRLSPTEVFVVGGPAVIADAVVSQVDAAGSWSVQRVAGADRFATSVALSSEMYPSGANVVYLAYGYGFPDALASAGGEPGPILLTRKDSVPPAVLAEIARLSPAQVLVAGGPAVVSDAVVTQVNAAGPWGVLRLAGQDRFTTSVAVAQQAYPWAVERVYVAYGYGFPDALAAGGALPGPVFLTRDDSVPAPVIAEIQRLRPSRVFVVGGPAVVPDTVVQQLRAANPGIDVDAQRDALVALYNATGGASWTNNAGWLSGSSYCTWYGVECAPDTSSVTGLDLSGNRLVGALPTEIGDLDALVRLDLSDNHFSGPIPPGIGRLQRLVDLNMHNSQLSGPMPAGVFTRNLRNLRISKNQLIGPIPDTIGAAPWLESAFLWGNQLSGSVPPSVARATNLQHLSLSGNQLSGSIPPQLGKLSLLRSLSLRENSLAGTVPAELGDLDSLEVFDLSDNDLAGMVPSRLMGLEDTVTCLRLRGQSGCLSAEGIPLEQWLFFMDPDWNDGCP